ncbi:MAG: DUF5060 domain-containing protein, partial [Anaerolineales bacterium]
MARRPLQVLVSLLITTQLLAACTAPTPAATPTPIPTPTPPPSASPAAAVEVSLDDFEAATTDWQAGPLPDGSASSALSAATTTSFASQGRQALELTFRAAGRLPAAFHWARPLDLSQAAGLAFSVFNRGAVRGAAIALATGPQGAWHTSAMVPLKAGQRQVTFDLRAADYATADTGGQYSAPIADLGAVRELVLLVWPLTDGSVVVDELRTTSAVEQASVLVTPPPPPAPTTPPIAPTRLELRLPASAASTFGLVELALDTDGVFSNPYDPAQVDLEVAFGAPSGASVRVPAFWYQAFDPATLEPAGAPGWRARFTPTEPGTWTAQAELAPFGLASAAATFEVADSAAPGFVRVNPANPHYFAFDDGRLYFPIGLNLAWASSLEQTVPEYTRWFDSLSANGGNLARLWMPDWGVGVEWNDTGLGDYTARQKQAWLLDQVFNLAEQKNVYILLSLLNHGAFSEDVNPEWDDNPYNALNGGPLAEPGDFVTDPAAREYFKRRVRYIASRYGYSTHLFAWEWWNEVNWTPIYDEILAPWIKDLTPTLRQADPNAHLLTNSYAVGSTSKIWKLDELSFMQQHDYTGADPAGLLPPLVAAFNATASKPVLIGEQGTGAGGASAEANSEAIHLHNGIWAPAFTGFAGTSLWWWWDTFVEPTNQWPQYRPLADFMQGEDLAATQPVTADVGLNAYAFALQAPDHALVWVRNRTYDAGQAARADQQAVAAGTAGADWTYEP